MTRSEKSLGNCCGCIPIRNGVLIIALISFLNAAVETLGLYSDDVRLETGGFTAFTRNTIGVVGVVGLFASLGGIMGCYDSSAPGVRSFWYFTVARIFVIIFVFAVDHMALSRCEQYRWKLYEPEDFNPTLSAIARARGCDEVRREYTKSTFSDLIISSYFSYVVWKLSEILLLGPTYLILFEKDVVKKPVVVKKQNHEIIS